LGQNDLKKQITVLVIEDDKYLKRLIKSQLENFGFERIQEANDGNSTFQILSQINIDLIIADWRMPGMDGLEFYSLLKNKDDFKDIPFLMVTGESKKEKVIEAFTSGIKNYIIKPFEAEDLERKVYKLLKLNSSLPPSKPQP